MRRKNFAGSVAVNTALVALQFVMIGLCVPNASSDEIEVSQGSKGEQIAIVFKKSVYEGDINKNVNAKDNLIRLIIDPLTRHYCEQHGIDREEEIKMRIADEGRRAGARYFVLRAELQRHLYKKYGGRVMLSAFGPVALDGTKKWIEEREKSGELQITDPKLRSELNKFLAAGENTSLFASPSQIKAAFDPANTDRFIANMAKPPDPIARPSQPAKPVMVTIGEVMGDPIQLEQRQLNDRVNLSSTLRDAFVIPLEQAFFEQHPEIEPSEKEIAAITAVITSNGEESIKSMNRRLVQIETKLKQAKPGTDEYGDLVWSQKLVEKKLSNVVDEGRRAKALLIARPAKLQQYLFDQHGGGRAIRRGPLVFAFDAQRKWVEEVEQQGHLKIIDPAVRSKFYDYWRDEAQHQANLTSNPRTARAWFNPPWIEPSVATNAD